MIRDYIISHACEEIQQEMLNLYINNLKKEKSKQKSNTYFSKN